MLGKICNYPMIVGIKSISINKLICKNFPQGAESLATYLLKICEFSITSLETLVKIL